MNENGNQKYLALFGRQPSISLAEIQAVLGKNQVEDLGSASILESLPNMSYLGGTTKLAQIIKITPNPPLDDSPELITQIIDAHLKQAQRRKINLGLSIYSTSVSASKIKHTLANVKQQYKTKDISIRTIPSNQPTLNAAKVIFNKLTSDKGLEIVMLAHEDKWIVAKTVAVQDVNAYSRRDHNKPVRDSKNGMLPPKLAQIMLNLAQVSADSHVLDPFCGTGTVLQEALLMGVGGVFGSDLSLDMVEASKKNLSWLDSASRITGKWQVAQTDATTGNWQHNIDKVVAETSLGPALNSLPSTTELNTIIEQTNKLHLMFLKNLHKQITSKSVACLAFPAWIKANKSYINLPVIDQLHNLGYNFIDFRSDSHKPGLYYHRPNAVVARRLIVLTKLDKR